VLGSAESVNALGRLATTVTELAASSDLNVPDGSVISLTAISAFVDGVSIMPCRRVTRTELISVIAPELV
jgi:hypothetical protein